jgi:hypothetical protein
LLNVEINNIIIAYLALVIKELDPVFVLSVKSSEKAV